MIECAAERNEVFEPQGRVLGAIREGMAVYDRTDRKVGTVRDVFMGGVDPEDARRQAAETAPPPPADDSGSALPRAVAKAFRPNESIPDELRERLEQEGYIAIDAAGLFAGDRYATADQIARVADDRVLLSASSDELARA
jgi:hypothetical protein